MQNIFAIYYKVNEYDLLPISQDAISDHPKTWFKVNNMKHLRSQD